MSADPGLFGPDSMMWRVNREITTLFGGARALLMHAAHPLVAAGARQTGGYRRDPWARLIRTVQLQHLVTFGMRHEAGEAADRINTLHKVIHGVDSVTGERYDALDYEQLLWVHLALEVSTIDFYELTVGPLTDDEKDQYHTENAAAAELMLVPSDFNPSNYRETVAYVDNMIGSGRLMRTDVADEVAWLIRSGPVPARIKPIWALIALAAVGTLDPRLRELYGLTWSDRQQRVLDATLALIRKAQPLLPYRYGVTLSARWAELRMQHPHVSFDLAANA